MKSIPEGSHPQLESRQRWVKLNMQGKMGSISRQSECMLGCLDPDLEIPSGESYGRVWEHFFVTF